STAARACRSAWQSPRGCPERSSSPTSPSSSSASPPRRRPASGLRRSPTSKSWASAKAATSHITEDLEAWYLNFPHEERVATVFRPGLKIGESVLTVPQGPDDVANVA